MNKVAERAIEYMIRPIKSYTGNGLLEQIRRVDEFQLSYFFVHSLRSLNIASQR